MDRVFESLARAKESYEHHLFALQQDGDIDENQHDAELSEMTTLHESHQTRLRFILDKHATLMLLSELDLALDDLEINAAIGYSSALNLDLDHAASLGHRARQARSKPTVHRCSELKARGDSLPCSRAEQTTRLH